ncbi:SIR2 family histone deacetylase [Lophiostoma macrostomum CBS 122681]|uniref:SIR2 family histone deacetylase n=1 Tax=Lophiostoma macrostomum CBS 122681 TaxID=1314788 RepID=A0A6A6SX66_9PLEO|nr:SIR2 family histone deacetylase [Lophiostoma macrostomum CBS 122681]
MSTELIPDYSSVVSATGFLRPRASRSLSSFQDHIITSRRILALLGAGLSASSGLPTFRGAGGLWKTHDVKALSTPAAFDADPALVWTFYLERIKAAQEAKPNAAHVALTELARKKEGFLAVNMNIDGLSRRAGHPEQQIHDIHGSLFTLRCTKCDLEIRPPDYEQYIHNLSQQSSITTSKLPRCHSCSEGLIRPGVVWFTESLPQTSLKSIYDWVEAEPTIDTMLVIGTSTEVYPATAYIEAARKKGARVAVVNIEQEDPSLLGLEEQDWYIQGDAADLVPTMLKPVIGDTMQESLTGGCSI